jgi:hypothetical protein
MQPSFINSDIAREGKARGAQRVVSHCSPEVLAPIFPKAFLYAMRGELPASSLRVAPCLDAGWIHGRHGLQGVLFEK